MPFLPPNQQRKSTEDNDRTDEGNNDDLLLFYDVIDIHGRSQEDYVDEST